MHHFKFQILHWAAFCSLTFFLCAGCKPKEQPTPAQPPAPPAPEVTNAPATNDTASTAPETAVLGTVTPEDAKNHIGKTVIVRGKVDRVYASQKGDVFIDMGGKHPNAAFTAVCFKQAIPTSHLLALDGKIISVKGKIQTYQGKVEIILTTADQISE